MVANKKATKTKQSDLDKGQILSWNSQSYGTLVTKCKIEFLGTAVRDGFRESIKARTYKVYSLYSRIVLENS